MKRYLLAAEADKIQDFIFRSAHLRQVVGGSQLLTRFSSREQGALSCLGISNADLIVSGGGSFRIAFDDEKRAIEIGRQLAEVYQRTAGSSLTVIPNPEPFDDQDSQSFADASKKAQEHLRTAKLFRGDYFAVEHIPYMAFCASCGVGLATAHVKRNEHARIAQYLCNACQAKGHERIQESLGEFLLPFVEKVMDNHDPTAAIWPGKHRFGMNRELDPTSDLASYDRRRYVAYLKADGNNIGKIFSVCGQAAMRTLSDKMTDILRTCLAEATQLLKKQSEIRLDVPVLPLILGGDDLFALLPAPWALDFTRQFCLLFEERMTAEVNQLPLLNRQNIPERITITAAIVICKESYPFYLAHGIAENLLKNAKRVTKGLTKEKDQIRSIVDFQVILGSQVQSEQNDAQYRATLRPYWVSNDTPPQGWGLPLHDFWNSAMNYVRLQANAVLNYANSIIPQCYIG
ncbi:MAG: hypothetical protein R3E79_61085 [Caldilineaceae bacterium]